MGIKLEESVYADPYYELYISGSKVDTYYQRFITDIEFEESDTEADLVRITVNDLNFEFSNRFQLTKQNSIKLIMGFKKSNRPMFEGVITHIEADFSSGTCTKVIGAIDVTNKMSTVKKSRKWKKKKSSEVVGQIAREHGFTPIIEPTSNIIEEITQEDETDGQLLNKLAEDEGYLTYIVPASKKIFFGSRFHGIGGATDIYYNCGDYSIISFKPNFVEKNKKKNTSASGGSVSPNTKKAVTRSSKRSASKPRSEERRVGKECR